jgi:hypothetical protein
LGLDLGIHTDQEINSMELSTEKDKMPIEMAKLIISLEETTSIFLLHACFLAIYKKACFARKPIADNIC